MAPDFRQRSTQPELMDSEAVSFDEFDACLRDLAHINRWTLAYRPTLCWLRESLRGLDPAQPVSLLDIGSGGGDMLRRLARWARRQGRRLELTGVDINPWSRQSAARATPPELPIRYETCDIFAFSPERRADFIISSLFTHHLSDDELIRFLRWMEAHARHGWFINDLHRHPLPYHVIRPVVRWLGYHRFVLHDAPVSVARGFTRGDWRRLLEAAGIPAEQVRIRWHFPFRYGVGRRRP